MIDEDCDDSHPHHHHYSARQGSPLEHETQPCEDDKDGKHIFFLMV